MSDNTAHAERACRHCGIPVPPGFGYCSRCGASVEPRAPRGDPLIDQLRDLFGRELEIERELGRGGMAAVYLAFDPALQRRVAVKSLLPEIAGDPTMVARFLREARTVAALQHPHVVSVHSVRAGEGTSAIVMQYVDGRSLDVVLLERSPLPLPLPVAGLVLSQVCQALQHAHDRGIVHRDVKPANVLIDHDGRAVVSDFGIARRDGSSRITGSGIVVGTMAYMSPEQRTGESGAVGPAADQYSLGVMAFELLGGRLPFSGGSLAELNRAHLCEPPPPLRQARPDVPAAVEDIVQRMLQKNPAARNPDLRRAEIVFRSLVPDLTATTIVLASLTSSRAPAGSEVRRAATTPAPFPATEPAAEPAADLAAGAAHAKAPSWSRRIAVGVVVVLILAGAAWRWRAIRPSVPDTRSVAGQAAETAREQGLGQPAPADAQRSAPSHERRANAAEARRDTAIAPAPGAAPVSAAVVASPGAAAAGMVAAKADQPPIAAPGAAPGATPGAVASTAATAPAAALADARAIAREFVTMLNKRQWRELEQLGSIEGDAALRAELVRLVRTAPDFAAGFDRVASAPGAAGDGFETECVLDLEWRGSRRLALVHLRAVHRDGAWRLSAFGIVRSE